MGLLALLFTDVFSCCLNRKVTYWRAHAEVIQTFVSFVLQCQVQGDLVQGFINSQNLGGTSVFHVSVGCRETSRTEHSQTLMPLCKMKVPVQCFTQDVGSSVIVTHWGLQRCKKGNEASLSI